MSQITFLVRTLVLFVCFSLFAVSSADFDDDQVVNQNGDFEDDEQEDTEERMSYFSDELSSVGVGDHDLLEERNNSVETDGSPRHGPPTAIMRER
jgi:hypothetical protein